MADNNIVVGASLQVDASSTVEASKKVLALKTEVKELEKAFKATKDGSVEQAQAFANLKAAQEKLKTSNDALNKTLGESSSHFANIKEGLGKVHPALSEAGEGANKLGTAFKALLANPIVALLAAVVAVAALVYKAFTNTFEGGEKVEQVFSGIKAAGQALLDNLGKIGDAIVKVFHFDFSGAIKDIKEVGDAAGAAYSKMSALTKEAQELGREQSKNDLEQAERQKKLAVLREQANDETVSPAKRKAALKELKEEAEKNAIEDVDLAKRTSANKIAQLTLEKDGALKNLKEINEAKIEAVRVETDNANELRRIDKQLTAANKQEKAERAAAAKEAAEKAKQARQELVDFTNKLLKLQQENELALLKDGYVRELKQLENKIADEKRANALSYQDHKITKTQQAQLDAALDIQLALQRTQLADKHNKEEAKKEAEFQKELAAISGKTKLDAISDVRKSELAQLEIGYQEKLQQAIEHYKDDQTKFQSIKNALDEQLKAAQDKAQAKFKKEDDKKKFEVEEEKKKAIIAAKNFDFAGKLQAVKDEQDLVQQAFDSKVISELDYNTKVAALSEARKTIREAERAHNLEVVGAIGDSFNTLAEIAGKQTAAGKALAIASTTINTFKGAIAAFTGMTEQIPGPVGIALGVVAAAGAVASGIAAVKKIVAVQVPGGGGGGSVPTGLPAQAAPVAPTQTSTQLDQKSLGAINNAASRVFVLDSDVKNNRDRDERLNRAARLGG